MTVDIASCRPTPHHVFTHYVPSHHNMSGSGNLPKIQLHVKLASKAVRITPSIASGLWQELRASIWQTSWNLLHVTTAHLLQQPNRTLNFQSSLNWKNHVWHYKKSIEKPAVVALLYIREDTPDENIESDSCVHTNTRSCNRI